jgi:putative redox protein
MLEVQAVWKKRYQVEVTARQFLVESDEPPRYGGDDTGMMPTELFLASVASCFCLALVYAAKNRKIKLDGLSVTVLGDKDINNFTFKRIVVRVISSLQQRYLEEIMALAKKYCFVSNTITRSCPIEYETVRAES